MTRKLIYHADVAASVQGTVSLEEQFSVDAVPPAAE